MIKRLTIFALAASLGACGERAPPPPPPKQLPPRPPAPEPPIEWLAAETECRGSLRRGEWLVCDNIHLRYLHRTLAGQWAAARQNADRGALRVMRKQQEALLSERQQCEDAPCVAIAYRRYVTGAAWPGPRPNWTPPRPRPPKPRPRAHGWQSDRGDARPDRRRGEQSCAAEIGGSASAYLVRQCRMVNGRRERGCTADRSCDDLREQIGEGCAGDRRHPGFCDRR